MVIIIKMNHYLILIMGDRERSLPPPNPTNPPRQEVKDPSVFSEYPEEEIKDQFQYLVNIQKRKKNMKMIFKSSNQIHHH